MSSIHKILAVFICTLALHYQSFSQISEPIKLRLHTFIEQSSIITFEEIQSDAVADILKHKVYYVTRNTKNTYESIKRHEDMFIVLDTGDKVIHFEYLHNNAYLPDFLGVIKDDFRLHPETAPIFEDMLDIIYPVADWKIDKREIVQKNDKWYFLRDAYFRTKQGFEVTIDTEGKIISICYKMKWDEPDGS